MSQDKQSAIEAAARASYEQGDQYYGAWDSLDPGLREYAIKNAGVSVAAYLSALVEDEGAVEAAARAMCVYQDHDPDRELESVGKDGRPVVIWMHWKGEARAALRALATRAQGESS
jgi:hypothetical protein